MARHRRPTPPTTAPTARARGQLAACLLGVSALAATWLAVAVEPDAPPAPDRVPYIGTADAAQRPAK
ncbi:MULTISPECIES: hypothetical protein [unclassified Streptomyces]|uniref:hypothetical protein n=1 Tax=unclassified Streptomyces TaxID=2593676 RepID=UPI00344DA7F6